MSTPAPGDRDRDARAEGKRPAPISASAFSFSLAKKPKSTSATTAPALPRVHPPPIPRPPAATPNPKPYPKPPSTPQRNPNPNPTSPNRTPAPITSHGFVTPTRPAPAPAHQRPAVPLGPLPSPLRLTPKSARPQKHLSALTTSPFKANSNANPDANAHPQRTLQAITAPRLSVAEVRAVVGEAEEGVGVSPRKHKVLHRGSVPPPSVRLANLVSAGSTALVLFYTSLQRGVGVGGARSCAQQIASAPIKLRVARVIPGPTHAPVLAECDVLAWSSAASGSTSGTARDPPQRVLLVLQALPADCPRVGLDARSLAAGLDAGGTFDVGVLAPWGEEGMPNPGVSENGEEGGMRVLFASRYLVAEAV